MKTVKVNLTRAHRYQRTVYGPGKAVEVPEGLAAALGLNPETGEPVTERDTLEAMTLPELRERYGSKATGKSKVEVVDSILEG
jgi:hypothetical protein